MSYITYARRRLRFGGFTRLAFEALAKMGCGVYPFHLVREGKVVSIEMELTSGFEAYELKHLGADDLAPIAALANAPGRSITLDELQRRLQAGQRCFAATRLGTLAAFTWYDLKNCTFRGYPFALEANEAYLFDAYTFLPFRGMGLAPYLRYSLYEELERLGRDTYYSISLSLNRPSLRFKEKLRVQKLVSGVYVELFGRWSRSLFVKEHAKHVPATE